MKPKILSLSVFAVITLCQAAHAAPITWDITPGTVGVGDAAVTGGVGTWDTLLGNWTSDAGANNIAWNNTANAADTATFTNGTGIVTVAEPITLGGLEFTSAGYTITGSSLGFGAVQGSIKTSALGSGSFSTTISSALIGTAGVTIAANGNTSAGGGSSTGRLTLSGDNTGLTGGIAITSGLVNFLDSKAAGSAAVTAGSGNAITISNAAGLVANTSFTIGNSIALDTGGATFRAYGNQTMTLNGVVSGSTALNKTDLGTVSLNHLANTFTGAANVQAGVLQLGNPTATSTYTFPGNAIAVSSGATLRLGSSSGGTIVCTYNFPALTAPISVNGGTVAFVHTNNTTQDFNAAIALSGASTISLATGSFSTHVVNLKNPITGTTGSLTFTGTGNAGSARNINIANAANNYAGSVTLGNASPNTNFNLNNPLGLNDWTLSNSGWILNIPNTTAVFKSLASTNTPAIRGTAAASILDVGSGNTDSTFSGTFFQTSANTLSLVKSGTGTLTLSGPNAHLGTTTLGDGTVSIASFGDAVGLGLVTATLTTNTTAGTQTSATVASAAGLTVGQNVYGPGVTPGTTITAITDNTLTLSANAVLAGANPTFFGKGNGLGLSSNAATNLVFNGGGLQYTGPTASTDRSFTVNAGKTATFDVSTDGTVLTVTGTTPATTGGLKKKGLGALVFTTALPYTGETAVEGGTLTLPGTLAGATSDVKLSGGGKLNLPDAGTSTVAGFFLDGVQQATGTWGSTSSPATHKTDRITGNGILNVTSGDPNAPYAAWVITTNLPQGSAARGDNPDQDGLNNFGEFAFDDAPLSGNRSGKVVVRTTAGVTTLTLPVREGAVFLPEGNALKSGLTDGVIYRIQASTDLVNWTLGVEAVANPNPLQMPTLSDANGWEYRTFKISGSNPKAFIRAKVSDTP